MERHKVTWLRQLLAAFVFDRLQDWWSARIVFAATKEARLGRENEFRPSSPRFTFLHSQSERIAMLDRRARVAAVPIVLARSA
jgi:hypothetical protein